MTLPAAASGNRFAQRLFAPLPARYDRLAEILSMGQNGRWRRAMVDQVAPAAGPSARGVRHQVESTNWSGYAVTGTVRYSVSAANGTSMGTQSPTEIIMVDSRGLAKDSPAPSPAPERSAIPGSGANSVEQLA